MDSNNEGAVPDLLAALQRSLDSAREARRDDERIRKYAEAAQFATEQATLGWPPQSRRLFVDPIVVAVVAVADAEQEALRRDLRETVVLKNSAFAELAELRDEVERLTDVLRDYDHRIAWDTTCKNCADILDRAVGQTFRAEAAEEKLARVEALRQKWASHAPGAPMGTVGTALRFLAAALRDGA